MTSVLLIIGGIFVLFMSLQFFVVWQSKRKQGKHVEGLQGELGRAVASGKLVMAYLYTPTCGACKTQTPIIDKLQRQHSDVFKINVAEDLPTAKSFGVMATPATVILYSGIVQEVLIGARSESMLRSFLTKEY